MNDHQSIKGPWLNRLATRLLTMVLAVLLYWLLGFFVQDIKTIEGPEYTAIEKNHVSQTMETRAVELDERLAEIDRQIQSLSEERQVTGDSSENLRQTMGQLIDLRALSIEKSAQFSEAEQNNLAVSLAGFIGSQQKYQELNARISELVVQRQTLQDERRDTETAIEKQREPAREEFKALNKRHRLKLAFLQLLILVPLLSAAAILVVRKRSSLYFPLFLAFTTAATLKVTLVLHEYFPEKYFKYILIGVLIMAVARVLVHFIRMAAFPKAEWLAGQYREAYERFLCPICEFPIRIGPRRFLYWTRRTVKKALPVPMGDESETPYTCPACGTALFEECADCGAIRHSLLAHCRHCGARKESVATR
ncbi:hypothetical protein JW905_04465 [bacterium]|nr:hypothetical protein [candidate division CSSED10-310 bacterium]